MAKTVPGGHWLGSPPVAKRVPGEPEDAKWLQGRRVAWKFSGQGLKGGRVPRKAPNG